MPLYALTIFTSAFLLFLVQPIIAKQGELVRVRYMNEGLQIHPMHLHGIPQRVIAKDGWP